MAKDVDKGCIDIRTHLNYTTIDLILETTLGNNVDVADKHKYIAHMATYVLQKYFLLVI